MAFYASVQETQGQRRRDLIAGPFRRHGDALRAVALVRRYMHERYRQQAPWLAYGTARRADRHPPTPHLEALGLRLDADGFVEVPR